MSWLSRFSNVFRPDTIDRALEDEARFHLESRVEDLVATGMTRAAAKALAERQFGGRLRLRESSRDVKSMTWLEDFIHDVRHALRALRRSPMFAGVAVLTLALGIGANTAILSIVNGVLLRPLAYPSPADLMYLTTTGGSGEFPVSVAEYLEFQQFNRSFTEVGAFRVGEVNLMAGDRAARVRSANVDVHLLKALHLQAADGRFFTNDETVVSAPARPGSPPVTVPVAMISHELWQSGFGARPVIGRTVEIDGRRLEVIGVMAPGVDLMDDGIDVWLPLGFTADERLARNNHNLTLIGRLEANATPASARRELRDLLATWSARTGLAPGFGHAGHVFAPRAAGAGQAHVLQMMPLEERMRGGVARSMWILQAAVGLVLLIACANIANLLLARAEARQHEFALLSALGARWGRLLRKVLTKSLVLSILGGAVGVLLARVAVDLLVRVYPTTLPRIGDVTVDVRVMAASAVLTVLCGLLFGLAAVMRVRSDAAAEALKSGSHTARSTSRHRLRRGLVVAETALAVIVLAGAGLLLRTVHNLSSIDEGFDRSRLVTFSITLPPATFDIAGRLRAYQRFLDQVRAVPGIEGASAMTSLPLDRPLRVSQTELTSNTTSTSTVGLDYQRVMSGFFETTGIPIVLGRGFQSADVASSGHVAIVNETLAKTYWKGLHPIDNGCARVGRSRGSPWLASRAMSSRRASTNLLVLRLYVLVDQVATPTLTSTLSITPTTMHVVLRTALPLAALAPTITRLVRSVDPAVPVARLRGMDDVFAESIRRPRLMANLLTSFGVLAVLLAAIGTYGVLASTVAERRREIGIRLALGAQRGRLLAQIMTEGLVLAAVGVTVGTAGAISVTRLLSSLLFGVQPTDRLTLAIVTAGIVGVAAGAAWLPAWRASRLDPTVVTSERTSAGPE